MTDPNEGTATEWGTAVTNVATQTGWRDRAPSSLHVVEAEWRRFRVTQHKGHSSGISGGLWASAKLCFAEIGASGWPCMEGCFGEHGDLTSQSYFCFECGVEVSGPQGKSLMVGEVVRRNGTVASIRCPKQKGFLTGALVRIHHGELEEIPVTRTLTNAPLVTATTSLGRVEE